MAHFLPALLTPRVVSTRLHELGTEAAISKVALCSVSLGLVFPLTAPETP